MIKEKNSSNIIALIQNEIASDICDIGVSIDRGKEDVRINTNIKTRSHKIGRPQLPLKFKKKGLALSSSKNFGYSRLSIMIFSKFVK